MKYAVVENAGYVGETDRRSFKSYRQAVDWLNAEYDADERDELHVAIAADLPDGTRTYEV